MNIAPSAPTNAHPTPAIPAAPAELMAAIAQPLVRLDHTGTQVKTWHEGGLGYRVAYRSERPMAWSDLKRADSTWHERSKTTTLVAPTYAGRNYDDALIAAAQVADDLGRWGHDDPRIRFDVASIAVLQADDGAYYLSTISNQQVEARSTNLRATGPWSTPSSSTGDVAKKLPSNDEPVTGDVANGRLSSVTSLSPVVRALVTNDTTYDLRPNTDMAR